MNPLARRRTKLASLILLVSNLCSCTTRPSELPVEEPWLVTVKSARIPRTFDAVARFAHHFWFDVRMGERGWLRLEHSGTRVDVETLKEDPFANLRWGNEVQVWEALQGEEAREVAEELLRQTHQYEDRDVYRSWPGPNSNTYVARMGRRVDGLNVPFHHNAIGKDYASIVQVGATPTGTGLELETPILGFEIGIREGVELHLAQFTLGFGIAPPSLKIPFLPLLSF